MKVKVKNAYEVLSTNQIKIKTRGKSEQNLNFALFCLISILTYLVTKLSACQSGVANSACRLAMQFA